MYNLQLETFIVVAVSTVRSLSASLYSVSRSTSPRVLVYIQCGLLPSAAIAEIGHRVAAFEKLVPIVLLIHGASSHPFHSIRICRRMAGIPENDWQSY